jgi:predicted dinucleotide-binding enzyme
MSTAVTVRDDEINVRPGRIQHGNRGAKRPKSFVGQVMRAARKAGHTGKEFGRGNGTRAELHGHHSTFARRGPFADAIGAEAADVYGAVDGAEVVLLAMAFPVAATLPGDLFDRAVDGVAIIDTSNYYPDVRDTRIPEIDGGMPESIWTSRQLRRPIFKAFNSIMFYALSELGKPEGSPNRLATLFRVTTSGESKSS